MKQTRANLAQKASAEKKTKHHHRRKKLQSLSQSESGAEYSDDEQALKEQEWNQAKQKS